MKKGQSGLEYLVTYGWAILAIVIIAGVLWYFGIFNPARFAGEKQCSGFSAFTCQDFRVAPDGTLTIVLNNRVGGGITSVDIAGTGACTPTTVAANANTTCTSAAAFIPAGTSGNNFDQTAVSLTYTDARSGIAHTDGGGFVRGKYE
ncbi:MAG TPA: hypothetical protein VI874_01835 [Candidatus Norongarragalinales archaeon]|nr:hypothetical protein [Candidatus Norongarragalinales archaeon]